MPHWLNVYSCGIFGEILAKRDLPDSKKRFIYDVYGWNKTCYTDILFSFVYTNDGGHFT